MEIWKLMETNKVNIDAKLYRQKIGLHCSIAPLCMEIGQPVALIQTKVSMIEVKSCHTFMKTNFSQRRHFDCCVFGSPF